MDYEEIKSFICKLGIKTVEDDMYMAFYFDIFNLRVGVFDHEYPNEMRCGKILAEHNENFDKWSKSFYSATFPNEEYEMYIILADFKHISDGLNVRSGNSFGSLIREFI